MSKYCDLSFKVDLDQELDNVIDGNCVFIFGRIVLDGYYRIIIYVGVYFCLN